MSIDRWLTDLPFSERYPFYTRANAGEVLPHPVSPLGFSTTWRHGTMLGWHDSMLSVGTSLPEELDPEEVIGFFGGYLYINAAVSRMFGVRGPNLTPEMIDFTYFGDHPDVPPYVAEDWHENAGCTARIGAWMQEVLTGDLDVLLTEQAEAERARVDRPDLTRLTDHELVERARSFLPAIRRMFERHIIVTAGTSIGAGIINGVCEAVGDPSLGLKLISGVGDVDSALPSTAMWQLSRLDPDSDEFAAGFDDFLVRYGSRGPNEWDPMSPVWETDPQLALDLIAVMRKQGDDGDPAHRHAERAAEREAVTERLRTALAGDPETLAQFDAGLASAHRYLAGRERAKTNIIRVIHEVRMAFRELAERHGFEVEEFHMLLDEELDAFVNAPDDFRARTTQRLDEYRLIERLDPPFIITSPPDVASWPNRGGSAATTVAAGQVLSGVPGCPGTVSGTARVILDPSDPLALEPGEILVAPLTDPAWTPLFVPAAGVVVDVGAQVSHAVIVSRELGLPCVVSVTGATEMIPDGATIEVDGDAGTVTVLAVPG